MRRSRLGLVVPRVAFPTGRDGAGAGTAAVREAETGERRAMHRGYGVPGRGRPAALTRAAPRNAAALRRRTTATAKATTKENRRKNRRKPEDGGPDGNGWRSDIVGGGRRRVTRPA
ncbi:hypothetical protein GCM10009864_67200 [Streptomyces lunalinharesii]|uniref:Uncharacterized protein n=1 Tax=Streptomyces lunalinharesii TaxID=333384 RepID=A0ABN3SSU8_9ACTN